MALDWTNGRTQSEVGTIMLNLLPNQLWQYGFIELLRGFLTTAAHDLNKTLEPISLFGLTPAIPLRSGRAAIVVGLQALALPPGARIGVPLYCCPVVFKAIRAAGHMPRFIDVEPDTYCLSVEDLAAKRAEVDAVIAVHMFGNLCDMPRLQEAAPGKPFIEDCAQSLGSRLNGQLAGSFAEIACFSFRSGKYLSVGEGGAVCSAQAHLRSRLAQLIAALPVASRAEECAHVVRTYLRSLLRSKPLWGLLGERLWKRYNQRVSYTAQSLLVLGQIYATDRVTIVRRLPLLDSWIGRQRRNSDFYSHNLVVHDGALCLEKPGMFYNRLQYPLLTRSPDECRLLATALRTERISTTRPYKDIAAIATEHYGYRGDCPQAERIAQTVLVIPCNHSLKLEDVERVTASVNSAWERIAGSTPGRLKAQSKQTPLVLPRALPD